MPTPRIHKELKHDPHFLTLTVLDWADVFTHEGYFQILANSLKFCIDRKGLLLYDYVFMTNHLHMITSASENSEGLDAIVRDFKRHTTLECRYVLKNDQRRYGELLTTSQQRKKGREFQLWQRENYAENIVSDVFLRTKTEYIWQNPVKKGYVYDAKDWRWGSARQKLLELAPTHHEVMVPCLYWEDNGSVAPRPLHSRANVEPAAGNCLLGLTVFNSLFILHYGSLFSLLR